MVEPAKGKGKWGWPARRRVHERRRIRRSRGRRPADHGAYVQAPVQPGGTHPPPMRPSAPSACRRHRSMDGDRLPVCRKLKPPRQSVQGARRAAVCQRPLNAGRIVASSCLRQVPSQLPGAGHAEQRIAWRKQPRDESTARTEEHPCSISSRPATESRSLGARKRPSGRRKAASTSSTRVGTGYVSFAREIQAERKEPPDAGTSPLVNSLPRQSTEREIGSGTHYPSGAFAAWPRTTDSRSFLTEPLAPASFSASIKKKFVAMSAGGEACRAAFRTALVKCRR
jgi:hypothetical protein